jgi:hypothetical protein
MKLANWLWRRHREEELPLDDGEDELHHAEERWKQEQTDQYEMNEIKQQLEEADTVRLQLEQDKAELSARIAGVRRLSEIRRPRSQE